MSWIRTCTLYLTVQYHTVAMGTCLSHVILDMFNLYTTQKKVYIYIYVYVHMYIHMIGNMNINHFYSPF